MAAVAKNSPAGTPRKSWSRRLVRLLRNATLCYLGIIIVLLFLENKLIFHPVRASEDWLQPPNALVQDVEMHTADGTKIHGWWCPVADWQPEQGAMLHCHGNAGNLSYRAGPIALWQQEMKQSVLIFDYPGYGKSDGKPSEAACYQAGDAAYDWLVQKKQVSPQQITLYGGSLGGGVAVDLASRRQHRALILVRTFTSMPEEAQSVYPWLPARWLVRTQFDNLAKIRNCIQPVYIAHGTLDQIIPFSLGHKLFEAANEPKRFCRMEGIDHNIGVSPEFYPSLRDFLAQTCLKQPGTNISED